MDAFPSVPDTSLPELNLQVTLWGFFEAQTVVKGIYDLGIVYIFRIITVNSAQGKKRTEGKREGFSNIHFQY